jgi:hypothetical protein
MKRIRIFLPLAVFICSVMAAGQSTKSSIDGSESLTEQPQQSAAPRPAASRSEEMLERWNDIGNKLIAMAQDFPEDKYDYKLQKDERTFALNLLHAAALDFVLIRRISGANLGPDFGEGDNPTASALDGGSNLGRTCHGRFQVCVRVEDFQRRAGHVVVDFRRSTDVDGIADDEFESGVREL